MRQRWSSSCTMRRPSVETGGWSSTSPTRCSVLCKPSMTNCSTSSANCRRNTSLRRSHRTMFMLATRNWRRNMKHWLLKVVTRSHSCSWMVKQPWQSMRKFLWSVVSSKRLTKFSSRSWIGHPKIGWTSSGNCRKRSMSWKSQTSIWEKRRHSYALLWKTWRKSKVTNSLTNDTAMKT